MKIAKWMMAATLAAGLSFAVTGCGESEEEEFEREWNKAVNEAEAEFDKLDREMQAEIDSMSFD